ncbi:hypothetical protein JRO89_XS13G0056500 [Xanthoceras sorbifolium]|uniref:J domain-containing protein n=1 Tax=Xanthoceras sorbifolium TaxID=99658 RepID=A0ABQ8H6R8_9ROSI|nr:hypothetical protein JRO89_XS13G0056500 [Xanthoceras sorbifolium]
MKESDTGPPNRELYALLHISPEASDEEIRKAYRQWAQVYHPDKYQAPHMKEIATENFQRICEAYEILSDENKRQIYDIYGMEGLTSGLELGPKLNKVEELKEELERLRKRKEQEKTLAHFRPSGTILATLSLPQLLEGDGIMGGMAMSSEVHSQLSKNNTLAFGGNLEVNENSGGGAASVVLSHQMSSDSSIEFVASAGLRALIGVQTTRHLSSHSTATMAVAMSLRDGSINLSNIWTRQLSETASGNIRLVLGLESSIAVGWQKKDERISAAGDLNIGTSSFEASAHYTRRFSKKSHGRIAGRFGSTALEIEVGGGRKVSEFSTIRMLYKIGIQGIFWKFELHRGGQKLIIPYVGWFMVDSESIRRLLAEQSIAMPNMSDIVVNIVVGVLGDAALCHLISTDDTDYNTNFAFQAFQFLACNWSIHSPNLSLLCTQESFALWALVHEVVASIHRCNKFVLKPYFLKREKQKALENMEKTSAQVREAKAAAEKAQQLLQNVANRKRNRQMETSGLVITKAIYGASKVLTKGDESCSQVVDVTLPLNFLVNGSGQLKLHEGVKKSGIMGFCDPCPGEPKQLYVEYTYGGDSYRVTVDDYQELLIPQEAHRI